MSDIDDRDPEICMAKPLIQPVAGIAGQRKQNQYQGSDCRIFWGNSFKLKALGYVLKFYQAGIFT